jgi:hypothetical protein
MITTINHAALSLLLLFLFAARAGADPPPIEAFGRLPAETSPVISADGHWLAWIDQREAQSRIIVYDVFNHRMHRALAAPPDIRSMVR